MYFKNDNEPILWNKNLCLQLSWFKNHDKFGFYAILEWRGYTQTRIIKPVRIAKILIIWLAPAKLSLSFGNYNRVQKES